MRTWFIDSQANKRVVQEKDRFSWIMKIKQLLFNAFLAIFIASLTLYPALCVANQLNKHKKQSQVDFWLTVLHNNDGESHLINAGKGLEDFGGAARFATLVQSLKYQATQSPLTILQRPCSSKRGVVMLSSGDNFLAGPEFNASLKKGVPFYDTIAMKKIGYDAIAIGNHEFDLGPDILADFIRGFGHSTCFLTANLDFSHEPNLQKLVNQKCLLPSVFVVKQGHRIGIVGATTPKLASISSPRNVRVNTDVAKVIQAEVDKLEAKGINKIILISHLQSIKEDLAMAPALQGVDIMIAGGGDELLANKGNLLIPGDEKEIFGPYPITAIDREGNTVLVVTTKGGYLYVGRLVVGFDPQGKIIIIEKENSGPVRVAGGNNPDAVKPSPSVSHLVTEPLKATVEAMDSNIIGKSEVSLDGLHNSLRTKETNEGNLMADALLYQARLLASRLGLPCPDIAIQNGGGIRNNIIIKPGEISELDTFTIAPFPSFVTIVPCISPKQLKEILENAVSRVTFMDGRFAQISGFSMLWDPKANPQISNDKGNIITPGKRIREIRLNNGTYIVRYDEILKDAPPVTIATINYLARGGDGFHFRDAGFTILGVTYQQALVNFIREGLNGVITSEQYPEGGEGRIKTPPL